MPPEPEAETAAPLLSRERFDGGVSSRPEVGGPLRRSSLLSSRRLSSVRGGPRGGGPPPLERCGGMRRPDDNTHIWHSIHKLIPA